MHNMTSKLIKFLLFITLLFSSEPPSGAFDHGSAAGKGNLDISVTWNPFNYFKHGQSYLVLGYGLTNRLDIHGYYSALQNNDNNYYAGLSYQFFTSSYLDLSTAVGFRTYNNDSKLHLFLPQLLYTVKLSKRYRVGGSIVNIKEKARNIGITKDIFLLVKLYENIKYKIEISAGGFNPVLWKPSSGEWYPTYSLDIKIK
jgi:hypothetical protein